MGTMIQALGLDEEGYRGARFDAWNREVRGNNDLLILTQPDAIRDIHLAYFRAGADIVSTNTFSSTRIAQADYGMSGIAYELNLEGARLARAAAEVAQAEDGRPRFVAGALGPTNRTASISPDVANPGLARGHLRRTAQRLCRAGQRADRRRRRPPADRDHLRYAQRQGGDRCHRRGQRSARRPRAGDDLRHHHRPFRTPAFRPDAGGVLEFGASRRAVLDRAQLRARRARRCVRISPRSPASPTRFVCAYPNAGLPNEFGYYDESPNYMAALLGEFAQAGLVNIVGGCCGTTPEHIHAIARAVEGKAPRQVPEIAAPAAAFRPRSLHAHAGDSVRQCGRAHQRHRLGANSAS